MTNNSKALMLGLFACFILTSNQLYKFLYDHVPVSRENKCLTIKIDGKNLYKIMVIKNHPVAGQCEIVVEFQVNGNKYYMPTNASYENLRDLDAKEVGCDEEVR